MSNFSIRYMATVGLLYLAGAYSAILVLPLQAQNISVGISLVGGTNDLSIGNPNSFTFPALRPMVIASSPTTDPNAKPADPKEELLDPETDSPVPNATPVKNPNPKRNDSEPTSETNNTEITAPSKDTATPDPNLTPKTNNTEITTPSKDTATPDSEIPICPIGTPLKDC